MKGFRYGSTQGAFYILPGEDGWAATYGNETLGEFSSPQQAADEVARGLSLNCPHLSETDTSMLDVPEQLSDWEIVHV
ncbi:hypothetical protein [Paraburkholderia sp. BCC1886]|uniref:hypothetical protein n=1 Tax=Paraburkholderia sp. BCC1886 TaxID=2562670 RepID=UPI0011820BC2|nr:hypothetical protein [Paraburkholderia sp. BCC1886]